MDARDRQQAIDAVEGEVRSLVRGVRNVLHANALAWRKGLPPPAFAVMTHIAANHPVGPAAIAAATRIDRCVVSRQVAALRREGFVVSAPDPADGRSALFSPTAAAAEQFDHIRRSNRRRLDAAFADWSDEELAVLASVLDKFNRAVERF